MRGREEWRRLSGKEENIGKDEMFQLTPLSVKLLKAKNIKDSSRRMIKYTQGLRASEKKLHVNSPEGMYPQILYINLGVRPFINLAGTYFLCSNTKAFSINSEVSKRRT